MNMLNNLLDVYVDHFFKESGRETPSSNDVDILRKALSRDIRLELKTQMTEEEKKHLREELKNVEKEERLRLRRGRIATFIVEALVLAFFIGMIVNQMTNLIEQIRQGMSWDQAAFSVILIIITLLTIVIFLFVQVGIKVNEEPSDAK